MRQKRVQGPELSLQSFLRKIRMEEIVAGRAQPGDGLEFRPVELPLHPSIAMACSGNQMVVCEFTDFPPAKFAM